MFKTGSKLLFGFAAFGFLAAFVYAGATGDHELGMDAVMGPLTGGYKGYVGDHVGYSILLTFSFVSLFGGCVLAALRDADADAVAQVAGTEAVPEVPAPSTVNYWPVVGAFSLACIALGLAIGPELFVIGMVGATITVVEWAVRAWSDRATGDPEVNASIRNRFMYPVEIPGLAVLGIGGLVLAVSRILLALPKTGSYLVFGLVPVAIGAVGALVVLKPKLSQSVIAGFLLVGGLAVLAGGIVAAVAGEREHEGGHEEEETHEEGLAPLPAPALTVVRVAHR